jgi:hypothetical protein
MSSSRLLSPPRSFLFSSGVSRPTAGIRFGFKPLDANGSENNCCAAADFFMDITDISERRIMLTFHNRSVVSFEISDIIFADGDLFSISVQSARGTLEPGKLACAIDTGREDCYDPAAPDGQQDGIKPNESLGIIFDLQAGITLVDIIAALSRETMNISVKLSGDAPGIAEILINEPSPGLSPG